MPGRCFCRLVRWKQLAAAAIDLDLRCLLGDAGSEATISLRRSIALGLGAVSGGDRAAPDMCGLHAEHSMLFLVGAVLTEGRSCFIASAVIVFDGRLQLARQDNFDLTRIGWPGV